MAKTTEPKSSIATRLAEVLRDQLGLTGTKIGCDRGECGACTVIIDGRNIYSCSQLAVWMQGKEILTIEGLAKGDKLDPLQEAFIEHDGPQCGFCTSGQIMSGKALLHEECQTPTRPRRAAACPAISAAAATIIARLRRCSQWRRKAGKGGVDGTSTERIFHCRQENYRASTRTSASPVKRNTPAIFSCPACSMARVLAAPIRTRE